MSTDERDVKRRAIARARSQLDAGQGVSEEEIVVWLGSWGTPSELPPPSDKFEGA